MYKHHCMIAEVKPEYQQKYIDDHKNPWPELLKVIKESGIEEEVLFFHKNQTIVFFRCREDAPLDKCIEWQSQQDVIKKWNIEMAPMFSTEFVYPEKIFDLNQQLDGELKQD